MTRSPEEAQRPAGPTPDAGPLSLPVIAAGILGLLCLVGLAVGLAADYRAPPSPLTPEQTAYLRGFQAAEAGLLTGAEAEALFRKAIRIEPEVFVEPSDGWTDVSLSIAAYLPVGVELEMTEIRFELRGPMFRANRMRSTRIRGGRAGGAIGQYSWGISLIPGGGERLDPGRYVAHFAVDARVRRGDEELGSWSHTFEPVPFVVPERP